MVGSLFLYMVYANQCSCISVFGLLAMCNVMHFRDHPPEAAPFLFHCTNSQCTSYFSSKSLSHSKKEKKKRTKKHVKSKNYVKYLNFMPNSIEIFSTKCRVLLEIVSNRSEPPFYTSYFVI